MLKVKCQCRHCPLEEGGRCEGASYSLVSSHYTCYSRSRSTRQRESQSSRYTSSTYDCSAGPLRSTYLGPEDSSCQVDTYLFTYCAYTGEMMLCKVGRITVAPSNGSSCSPLLKTSVTHYFQTKSVSTSIDSSINQLGPMSCS